MSKHKPIPPDEEREETALEVGIRRRMEARRAQTWRREERHRVLDEMVRQGRKHGSQSDS